MDEMNNHMFEQVVKETLKDSLLGLLLAEDAIVEASLRVVQKSADAVESTWFGLLPGTNSWLLQLHSMRIVL